MDTRIRKLEVYSIERENQSLEETIRLLHHNRFLSLIIPEDSATEAETEWHDDHRFNFERPAHVYRQIFDEMRGVKEDNSDLMAQRARLLKSGSPGELVEFAMRFNPKGSLLDRFHPSFSRVPVLMFVLFSILCSRRDKERVSFSEDNVASLLKLERLLDIHKAESYASVPDSVMKMVAQYLATIPGFSFSDGAKQSNMLAETCLSGDIMVVGRTMKKMKQGDLAW